MKFTFASFLALSAASVVSAANTIQFTNQDDIPRRIIFTTNPGHRKPADLYVSARSQVTQKVDHGWQGNLYAIPQGAPDKAGMLAEFTFNGFEGQTFFDVSAIVNPYDHNNVKQIWPVKEPDNISGCNPFPCDRAYYAPNDQQTRTTWENDFIVTLGTPDNFRASFVRAPLPVVESSAEEEEEEEEPEVVVKRAAEEKGLPHSFVEGRFEGKRFAPRPATY
ncbi:hypothetical protein B0T22DRAFT_482889 [Podospora appendiculata]|uniref:Dnase1 protein n=1 Tax=Podospora appendiculata TaxID=314037 RepID=A0AAE0X6S5_9PEZI|nr:hypothetical protein B0T22DRAFT_482889 [Podospora appendiculata]